MDESAVTIVLLAAGLSRRFGATDKLLAPFDGVPLVAHAARASAAIAGARRMAVVSTPEVGAVLAERNFDLVENSDPRRGMGHSIALALRAMTAPGAVLVMLGDMPGVAPAHLRALIAAFTGARPVCSSADGVRMPPAIFAHGMLAHAVAKGGDTGARALLADAEPVPAPAASLADVDFSTDVIEAGDAEHWRPSP